MGKEGYKFQVVRSGFHALNMSMSTLERGMRSRHDAYSKLQQKNSPRNGNSAIARDDTAVCRHGYFEELRRWFRRQISTHALAANGAEQFHGAVRSRHRTGMRRSTTLKLPHFTK